MSGYPCPIGAKFIDHYSHEVVTVVAFRAHGKGFQVHFETDRNTLCCSWTQFKHSYKPQDNCEEVGRGE